MDSDKKIQVDASSFKKLGMAILGDEEAKARQALAELSVQPQDVPEKRYILSIEWCGLCRCLFVRCPRCGNNTCNSGYGENGECPVCPKAYDIIRALDSANLTTMIEEALGITEEVAERLWKEERDAMGFVPEATQEVKAGEKLAVDTAEPPVL